MLAKGVRWHCLQSAAFELLFSSGMPLSGCAQLLCQALPAVTLGDFQVRSASPRSALFVCLVGCAQLCLRWGAACALFAEAWLFIAECVTNAFCIVVFLRCSSDHCFMGPYFQSSSLSGSCGCPEAPSASLAAALSTEMQACSSVSVCYLCPQLTLALWVEVKDSSRVYPQGGSQVCPVYA